MIFKEAGNCWALITLTIEHLQVSDLPPEWARRLNVSPEQTVTVQINTEEDQEPTQPKFSSGNDKELYLWSPRQTAKWKFLSVN